MMPSCDQIARPSPTFGATIGRPSGRYSVSSYCFAGGSTSTDARCWPGRGRGSRRATTRIATAREPRCKSSFRAADERLDDYLRRLDEDDVAEGGTGGGAGAKNLAEKIAALRQKRGRYGSLLAELERTGESQISLTYPDSRAMAAHTKVGVGYNAQVAADAKHKMMGAPA